MCFSATASFGAAAVLVPAGIYCLKKASLLNKPYWLIAMLPLVFGLQQIFEGFVWLALAPDGGGQTRYPALGFLFFSHLFWLFWVPLASYVIEDNSLKKKVILVFVVLGTVHGLLMYIPLWFYPDWLLVELVQGSIDYKATLLHDDYMPRIVVRALYAVIILFALLISSDIYVRIFGVIIGLSVAFATYFYGYAFISVWCFFAAILSLYILLMILRVSVKSG